MTKGWGRPIRDGSCVASPGICWRAGHAVKVPTAPPAAERGARPRAGSPVRWTGTCLRRPRRSLPRRVRRPDSGSPAEVRPDRPRRGQLVAGRRRHEAGSGCRRRWWVGCPECRPHRTRWVRRKGRTLCLRGHHRLPRSGWGVMWGVREGGGAAVGGGEGGGGGVSVGVGVGEGVSVGDGEGEGVSVGVGEGEGVSVGVGEGEGVSEGGGSLTWTFHVAV